VTNWFKPKDPTVQAMTRQQIEDHVAEFLAKGGAIEQLEHTDRAQPMITPMKRRGVAIKKKPTGPKRTQPLDFNPPIRKFIDEDE
jgi:hypothetical protein